MYLLIESLRSALASIRAHRMRSFLTSLGIIIGVASVITVVSLIQGLTQSVGAQFDSLGGSTLTIRAQNEYKDFLQGTVHHLRFEDVDQLRLHIDDIKSISPNFSPGAGETRYGNSTTFPQVIAATASYQDVQQRYVRLGRFLSDSDEAGSRRVVVIGEKLIETLHLPENPIGQFIFYSGEWFKIIGVMEKRGEIFGFSQDDFLFIPYKTGRSIIGNNQVPNMSITLSIKDLNRIDEVKQRIFVVMRNSHRLKPEQTNDFKIESSDQIAGSFKSTMATITAVMGGIVSISLLVGGIGIMNIMLVSVTERTREIGICKAIGARSRDIMMQFLIEAVVLSVMGGIIGMVIGYGLGFGIAKMIPNFPDAFVPWWAVAMSFAFSGGVGIVFGVIPASNAAKLDPIDALRYE